MTLARRFGHSTGMLSFGKVILIVVVIVGVMVAFSVAKRLRPPDQQRAAGSPPDSAPNAGRANNQSADLKACPRCGTYTQTACGKPDCPLGR